MWRCLKDRIGMIAYHNIEMLQDKISEITRLSNNTIKSICGNQFYKEKYFSTFNV